MAGFIGSPAMNLLACSIKEKAGKLLAAAPGMELAVSDESATALKSYVNKEVFLGLRPEHISDSLEDKQKSNGAAFKAFVRLVEPLGSEQLVHLEMEKQRFIARIDPRSSIKYGETLAFNADMNAAVYFDTATEARIV